MKLKVLELWDEPINDQFTFGDLMTNALENSMNIEYGYFIIINDKKFSLINDNNEFNMDVVSIIMSKEILIYTKPKNMSNLDYISSHFKTFEGFTEIYERKFRN